MIFVLIAWEIIMRACFAGPNILALGYGVAIVQVPHRLEEKGSPDEPRPSPSSASNETPRNPSFFSSGR